MRNRYFFNQRVNILENSELRDPQIDAYIAIYDHCAVKTKDTEAIVVLPTGAGKTGLMALAPFFISEGRVLIIAPQLTILDTLENALSTDKSSNFWIARKVISDARNLPKFAVYNGSNSNNSGVGEAEIVLANIQKMHSVHGRSLINQYSEDYFDMILIDEAHHSSAQSWIDVVNHFKNAKIV